MTDTLVNYNTAKDYALPRAPTITTKYQHSTRNKIARAANNIQLEQE